jgi:predicted PurR-regulated permease PerM
MNTSDEGANRSIFRAILLFAAVLIILWMLHFLASILLPLLFAILLAIVFAPLMLWLVKKGWGNASALTLTATSMIVLLIGLSVTVAYSFSRLIASFPDYAEDISTRMSEFPAYLSGEQHNIIDTYLTSSIDVNQIVNIITGIGLSITEFITGVCIIAVLAIFVLYEIVTVPTRYKTEHCKIPRFINQMSVLFTQLIDYMVVRTKINLLTGFGTMLGLYIIGIDFAYLWGICAFILAYIPYVGFTISLIPAAILGFIQFGITGVILVIAIFSVVNLLTDILLFPYIASEDLNLSPFIIFFSVFFFVFLLGPFSSLIAVPITMAIKILLEQYDDTKWIAVFMSGNSQKKKKVFRVSEPPQ